jgi:3-phosphoshikimate 1-carboxyvinyltransferase
MAMAVMSLNATSPLSIQNADSVNKSYPKFWEDFEKLTK